MRATVDELGQTVVMVTHDAHGASYADRLLFLADGQVVEELHAPDKDTILDTIRKLGD
jgi:putative ABC transport system ATP-binding protein